ncbi:MAG: aminodeoxychorismate synthase component I [Chitinispirillaceae bacterium]|nr:aminodeoxychorismate synthase component I [Chitinispirillaceae bacterium]
MPSVHPLPIDSLGSLVRGGRGCVFLDNARPTREQRYSFFFRKPVKVIRCSRFHEVRAALDALALEAKRHWVAGYCTYEAGYALEERFSGKGEAETGHRGDLLWFGVFNRPHRFDHFTGVWDRPVVTMHKTGRGCAGRGGRETHLGSPETLTRRSYENAVRAIQKKIAAGEVYQVNYTFAVPLSSPLQPWDLFLSLRKEQPVAFGAFIATGRTTIASFSPELFFMQTGSRIVVKPMKGTAPRGRFSAEDEFIAAALARDPKNRSENIMIVDLLRNDLGKICRTGSISVERLFEVERHPTLHQMTSTIVGRLKKGTSLAPIMNALFPSGSVTGAPKIRAMELIRGLEKTARGVYCGAIGYSSPEKRSVFSVPIRTLSRERGQAAWRYGVGSGIVWDSVPRDEWHECAVKCGFLTARSDEFRIFESMAFSGGTVRYGRDHYVRMRAAADYFAFPFYKAVWDAVIREIAVDLGSSKNRFKVRTVLDRSGAVTWNHDPILPERSGETPVILLFDKPVRTATPFLFHKTTVRPWYEKSMQLIRTGGCFDVIHINERGQLTEGARTNLFVKIDNVLYTPPIECGLLPGILRARLLAAGKCRERILYPADLEKARAVYCGNSVRGLVQVRVER